MSNSIDERVVEMQFDNKQFNSGIASTVKALGDLKRNLKFENSVKSISGLEKAVNKINLSTLEQNVQAISNRFSTLGVVATTALANISNSAINAGKQLVSALSLEPLKSGFAEYELQMNSIQTILNNTKSKGSTLDDVNRSLAELNTYADQTIYNFSQMTQNIGRFTAAGVDLETSVASIKGLSNLAAFFGSDANQASSAMYQLSQAIAAGKVQLMDWNSVVNAGMGGPEFQNALIRTAEHFGTNVDGMIEKYGSFRESLTKGEWLTSDVLTETLKQISGAYSEADLIAQGYTEDQAKAITQLAADATEAATKVRTFTQLMSTIQESMGSGWTTSWQIIEGDFEEATKNWSTVYKKLDAVIQKSSDDRNKLLTEWADLGGRTELWSGIGAMIDTILMYTDAIKKGFQDIFPPATAQQLYDLTKGFNEFWQNALKSSDAAETLRGIVSDFASVLKWVIDGVTGATDGIAKLADGAGLLGTGFLDVVKSFSSFVKGLTEGIDLSGAFSLVLSALGDAMGGIGRVLSFLGSGISIFASAIGGTLSNLSSGFSNLTGSLGTASQGITEIILTFIQMLPEAIGTAISAIGNAVGQILDAVPIHEVNSAIQDTLFTVILANINRFVSNLQTPSDEITGLFENLGDAVEKMSGVLDAAKGPIKSFATSIKANALIKIAVALGILAASIKMLSTIPIDQVATSLGALAGGMVIMGAAGIAIIAILKKMSGGLTGAIEIASLAKTLQRISVSMLLFAASIKILSGAMSSLSNLSWDEIFRGLVAIGGLSLVIVGVTKLLDKTKGLVKASFSLMLFAGAIGVLSAALNSMKDLGWDDIIQGLVAIAGSAAVLVAASKLMSKGASNFIRSSIVLFVFSASIRVMAEAMKAFSEVGIADIIKSVSALAGLMTILKLFSKTMGTLKIGQAISVSAVLLSFSVSLSSFADVAGKFDDIDLSAIGKMTLAVGLLMGELSLFSSTLKGNKNLLEISGGIWLVVDAVNGLAESVKKFSELSIEDLGKGLLGVAGGLAIMLAAMKAMPDNTIDDSIAFIAVALSLKAMANAVKEFGSMDLPSIGRALLVFAGSMTIMSVAAKALKGTAGGSGSLALFAFGLSLLVGPLKTLGDMDVGNLAKAILALAASLTVVGVASKILGNMSGSILKTAASLIVMGAAITIFGIGLSAMIFPIKQLAELDGSDLSQGVVALSAVIGTLFALVNTMNALPDFSVKTVAKVAIMAAVIAGVGGVIGQLASIDSSAALQSAVALSGTLVAATAALKVLDTVNIAGAAKGVATLAIVIGGIAAVVAAAGGIAQIPGAKWLIGEGAAFLSSLGQALGGFIGGFVGGIAGGAISAIGASLPAFGQSLSDFMSNAEPFFSSVGNVNPESLQGINSLAQAILALTAANVVEAATSWLTGGNTMVNFGQQLSEFAPYYKKYADTMSGIDANAVSASATAAKGLAEFANSLPASGGLLQKVTGENDIAAFGKKLEEFGPSFSAYATSVSGIDASTVINSANAAKALSEFATSIPASGGLLQKVTGENDIVQFGNKLKEFGPALKAYSDSITGLDGTVVVNSANAAKALAEVANNLPSTGGALQWLMGEKDLGSFGSNLKNLGDGMKKYGESVAGIDPEAVTASTGAAKALVEVANSLEQSGGALEFFTGKKDLSGFGDNIANFGNGMKKYGESVAGVDPNAITASAGAAKSLADIANSLSASGGLVEIFSGTKDLSGFAGNLESLGQGISKYASAVAGADFANVQTSVGAVQSIAQIQSSLNESGGVTGWWSGEQDLSGFAGNLESLGQGISKYASAVAGSDFASVSASATAVKQVADVVGGMSGLDMSGLTTFSDTIKNVGDMGLGTFDEELAVAATNAATYMGQMATSITDGGSKISTAFSTLKADISGKATEFNLVGSQTITELINGMVSAFEANSSRATSAMRTVCDEILRTAQSVLDSGPDKFRQAGVKMINALVAGMNSRKDAVNTTVSSIINSISIPNVSGKLYSTGQNIVNGLVNGMKSRSWIVSTVGASIGQAAVNAVNAASGVHSPSRITMETGKYIDLGLTEGLYQLQDKVREAGTKVGNQAVNAVNASVSKFSADYVNSLNSVPTIRPVIDADDEEMKNLFSSKSNRTVTFSGAINMKDVASSNAVLADRIAQEQQATRESNQRVIDEISGLREDLSNFMNADPSEIGLYVDGRKLASSIAGPMNRSLNILSKRGGLGR